MERTFVMVKPDGVQRGLVGNVMSRLENKGLKLVGCRFLQMSPQMAETHYGVHRERPFFGELVSFITSGPVLAMVWEGPSAIKVVRNLVGATNPEEAAPGSIRGDRALEISKNVVHASDGPDTARFEIDLFFQASQLVEYSRSGDEWILSVDPSGTE